MTRQILLAATAIALLGGTSAVHAQKSGSSGASKTSAARVCSEQVAQMDQNLKEQYGRSGRDIRTLHQAAMVFERNGQTEACQEVVRGIQEYLDSNPGSAGAEAGEIEERVKNATPLDQYEGAIRAGELIGAKVISRTGETLGNVDDIVMSADNETRYLLVGTGGFLALGEEYVPIKAEKVSVIDQDTLVVDVDEARFKEAPKFDMDTIEGHVRQWADDTSDWWEKNVTAN